MNAFDSLSLQHILAYDWHPTNAEAVAIGNMQAAHSSIQRKLYSMRVFHASYLD